MQMPALLKQCQDVQSFLVNFLDGVLPVADSMIFRLHVLLCAPCRRYMNRYNDSVELARNILDDPPPPELINLTSEFIKKQVSAEADCTADTCA